jgi:predicted acetyltransferase
VPTSGIVVTEGANQAHHELYVDGVSVSELWVVYRTMRIGGATVRMGGIASVGTLKEHRNRGYSRRVLENCTEWMAAQGFDCATLFGIPDYYHRFGYAPCLIDCELTIATRRAERAEPRRTRRPFTPEDRPALARIYAEQNARQTGSVERSADSEWFAHGSSWYRRTEAWVFCDPTGRPAAYAARDASDEAVTVCDLGAATAADYADILRWAADCAIELRCGEIRFHLPLGHPFADYAAHFGARVTATYHPDSDGMGRILNLETFLRAIAPELATRARAADASPGSVRLETDLGASVLTWDGAAVGVTAGGEAQSTVRLPQHRLMQAAMGYHSGEIVLALPEASLEGDGALFRALFPHRPGYMWLPDHF